MGLSHRDSSPELRSCASAGSVSLKGETLVTWPHLPSLLPLGTSLLAWPARNLWPPGSPSEVLETALRFPCLLVQGPCLSLSKRLACLLCLSHPLGKIILRKPRCSLCSAPSRSEHSLPLEYLISLPRLLAYCQGNWNQTPAYNEINVLKTSVYLRVELGLLLFDNLFNSFGLLINRQLCILWWLQYTLIKDTLCRELKITLPFLPLCRKKKKGKEKEMFLYLTTRRKVLRSAENKQWTSFEGLSWKPWEIIMKMSL